jgi:hypothetical protein
MTGDRGLALQAMVLDPYVRSLPQAKAILDDFLAEYREELPQFQGGVFERHGWPATTCMAPPMPIASRSTP